MSIKLTTDNTDIARNYLKATDHNVIKMMEQYLRSTTLSPADKEILDQRAKQRLVLK